MRSIVIFVAFSLLFALINAQKLFLNEQHLLGEPGAGLRKVELIENTFLRTESNSTFYFRINRDNNCQPFPVRNFFDGLTFSGLVIKSDYDKYEYISVDHRNYTGCAEAENHILKFDVQCFPKINPNTARTFEVPVTRPLVFEEPKGLFQVLDPLSDCSIFREFSDPFFDKAPLITGFGEGVYYFSNQTNRGQPCHNYITVVRTLPPALAPPPTVSGAGGLYAISLVALIASSLIAMIALF